MRAAILLLCLLAPAAARADHNEIVAGGATRALRAASADAVTADSLDLGSFGYAREIGLPTVPGLALWAELGFEGGSVRGTMFQTMTTKVESDALVAGVRAHYRLHRLVDATARLAIGTAHTSLDLDAGGMHASDGGWGGLVHAGLGVDGYVARTPQFGLGVRLELGYTETSAVELTPRTGGHGDMLTLPTTDASIGHLDLTGPSFAIALVGTF